MRAFLALASSASGRARGAAARRVFPSLLFRVPRALLAVVFASRLAAGEASSGRVLWRHPIDASAEDVAVATSFDSPGARVIALGTNTAPGRVHFLAAPLEEDALESPSFSPPPVCGGARSPSNVFALDAPPASLPSGFGAVRSAAAHPDGYLAFGTDDRPGVVFPGGLLSPGPPLALEPGEDVLASAAAVHASGGTGVDASSPPPAFVFVTWTTPSRAIKLAVDREESRSTLRRVASRTMPAGIDRVRVAAADPRPGADFVFVATDQSPAVIAKIRASDLTVADAFIVPTELGGFIRAGTMTATDESLEEGAAMSFWVTRGNPATAFALHHAPEREGELAPGSTMRLTASIALDATSETRAESLGIDESPGRSRMYVGFAGDAADPTATSRAASFFYRGTSLGPGNREGTLERAGGTVDIPGTRALLFARANDGVSTWITRASPAEIVAADHDRDADDDARVLAAAGPPSEAFPSGDAFVCVAFVNETHVGAWRQRVPPEAVDTREKREAFREALNAASDAGGGVSVKAC